MADNEFNFIIVRMTDTAAALESTTDPAPGGAAPEPETPGKKPGRFTRRAIALVAACAVVGGAAGVGGAAVYQRVAAPDTVMYQGERPTVDVDTVANSNGGQPMTPRAAVRRQPGLLRGHYSVHHHGELLRTDHHLGGQRLRLCPHPGRVHCHQLPRD